MAAIDGWKRTALYVFLAIFLPATLWAHRGPVIGIVALVVYGPIMLMAAFRFDAMVPWSQDHPVLDTLAIAPIAFLGATLLPGLSLLLCAAIGVAAAALIAPLAARPRRPARRGR
jgi:hypothetical protein